MLCFLQEIVPGAWTAGSFTQESMTRATIHSSQNQTFSHPMERPLEDPIHSYLTVLGYVSTFIQYWWKHELMSETGKKKKREKSSINSDVKSFLLQRCRRDLQWRSSLHPLLLWSLLWRVHGSAVYGMPKRWMQLFIEPEMTGFNSLYIIVIIVIINVIIIIITYYIIII